MKLLTLRTPLILLLTLILNFGQNILIGQNFIKNAQFDVNMVDWSINTINCPVAGSSSWQQYSPNLEAGFPVIWEGTAFLKNKIVSTQGDFLSLGQNLQGLNPAAGNAIQIKMDLILGEAKNLDANSLPAEYADDNLTLEVYLNGTLYASVATPKGWKSALGDEFGKCFVSYYNGASSLNYTTGNSMTNISNMYQTGQEPYLFPVKNENWDIEIPWECDKPNLATLEIRIFPTTYLGKSITDTRGLTYLQTCTLNNFSNLDNIAIDNIQLKNKLMPSTPELSLSTITSTTCGQSSFDLNTSINTLINCPTLDPNAFEYVFYSDQNLTQKIEDPSAYNVSEATKKVYAVLATKITDSYYYLESATKRELTIVKNEISTAGSIGVAQEICSGDSPSQIKNQISPIIPTIATQTFSWEMAIGSISGVYSPASGTNTNIDYSPATLVTTNEYITNYYFKRKVISTLNGLSCNSETSPIEIKVLPCAPVSVNEKIEYFENPGSNLTITVPNTLFEAAPLRGNLTSMKLLSMPIKTVSLKVITSTPAGRTNATTTYCPNPANGCVGTPFPSSGLVFPVNTMGNPINTTIELDPQDGSFQTVFSFNHTDSRGFISTTATSAILFSTSSPLAVNLIEFDAKSGNDQNVYLNWKTSEEINFSHFEVQLSKDNLKFETVKKVAPNENKNYGTEINNIENGAYYVRLKMVDNDGSFDYSKIKNVVVTPNHYNKIIVKGNPVNEFIKVDLNLKPGLYIFKLFDIAGKNIVTLSKNIVNFENDFKINQLPLNSGMYFLNISNKENFLQTYKVAVN